MHEDSAVLSKSSFAAMTRPQEAEDAAGRIKFLDDKEERIGWYESGYANIPFYFLFTFFFGFALWRVKTASRWLCGLALCVVEIVVRDHVA